jgi:phenylalanyl-tRNA synthetase beta chain
MRLLVSWVREFVPVTAPPAQIADALALRGFEVASIEAAGPGDAVIDFEVTANRPDCLGVLGFAREIATTFDLPLQRPSGEPGAAVPLAAVSIGESERLKVALDEPDLCPRYSAAVAEVTPAVSPAWMTGRLQAAGVRPISPFVDVTNYVLLELGHPMHAFDLARLAGAHLRIRRAKAGELVTTLDGVERALGPEMLVIADANRAQAIAGVMGGADSEVSGTTRTVAFESACFDPVSVRRTAKRLGLKTEASARFERGVDVNGPLVALRRALGLMQQIGAGRIIGPVIDRYPRPRGPQPLRLRRDRLSRLLGLTVPDQDVERILAGLGLEPSPVPEGWAVAAPTFRVDLLREIDLIEEVGRHFGFDRLEPTFPVMTAAAPPPDPRIPRDQLVRRILAAAGLSEAVTFGFLEAAAARPFIGNDAGAGPVGVANPLSAKFDVLRPSLLPGLVDALAHNRRHGRRDVALFEIGARFTAAGESRGVGLAWTGLAGPAHWAESPREVDFYDAKGVVERLCGALGIEVRCEPVARPYLEPGQAAAVVTAGNPVGILGVLAGAIAASRGAPQQDRIVVAEIDLDRLAAQATGRAEAVAPLPRHPFVVRDLSFVVADSLPAEIIRGTIQAAGGRGAAPLVSIAFFDRYTGRGIPAGSVSLSVRLTFQAPDRTLTDLEVQESVDRVLAALRAEHGAVQR